MVHWNQYVKRDTFDAELITVHWNQYVNRNGSYCVYLMYRSGHLVNFHHYFSGLSLRILGDLQLITPPVGESFALRYMIYVPILLLKHVIWVIFKIEASDEMYTSSC